MSKTDWNNIKRRLEDLRSAGGAGDRCPECGSPADGPPRLLITVRNAVTGEFCGAELDGEKISEDELREFEAEACSTCRGRGTTINIGGGTLPSSYGLL
jgi:hypothetical protein